jgi:hypothetical protein
MRKSKMISLFKSFNANEFKAFDDFLLSPYFNQSDKLVKFFRLIKPHFPLFESDKLEKEKLYKALHGKSPYSDSTMRELISEMFKLSGVFLAHNNLKQNNPEAGLIRYEWFFSRQLEKLAEAEMQSLKVVLDSYSPHDAGYYRHRWLSDRHQFEIMASRFIGSEYKLLQELNLFEHVHSLNREYLVNSFTQYTYLLALARIYKFTLNPERLGELHVMAQHYIDKGDTVIDILYNIFQLNRTDEAKYYYGLKEKFLADDMIVPKIIMLEAGIALENYCSKKLRDGEDSFSREVMEIYRFEVEHNYAREDENLNQVFYLNVAIRGAESDYVDWTSDFIESHKKFLSPELQEDSYNFAKAHVLFARKNYLEALRLALTSKVPFFVSKIILRNLIARAHYELGMLDELEVELYAHRHHIKDEKLTEERRDHLETFITVMKQLAELKGNYNRGKLINLSRQVDGHKGFANKKWFQEKIKELIK